MELDLMASKMGIYKSDLEKLIQGQASYGVASKLDVYKDNLQKFINGPS